MFLHPALDLKVFVVQLKTFMVQLKIFMVCGSSGAAQDCPHPALWGHLVLAEQRKAPKACSSITSLARTISAWNQDSQQENSYCNLMGMVLHSPVALLLPWVLSLLPAGEFWRRRDMRKTLTNISFCSTTSRKLKYRNLPGKWLSLGALSSPQFTQELPSLMGFGSRTDIKILISFSRKRQKKSPGILAERSSPSKPPTDQNAEGPGERRASYKLLFPALFQKPRYPCSSLVTSRRQAPSSQVCTRPGFHGRFPALSAGSDLNSWLPLTMPPAIISIFASDNSLLALGEQTTRYWAFQPSDDGALTKFCP